MQRPPSFFEGVAADALDGALAGLELRRFPAGSVIIAEGDYRGEMYVLRSGTADAVLVDRKGEEHVLNTIHPGEAIGEMSLLTESAASATVRARDDVELLVLEAADLDALLEALPQIQRNLVRTLSSRLARVSRLALHEQPGRLVVVEDDGDAEELPFALAASIAWHTRSRTLHVALGTMPPARDEPREGHGGARTIAADVGGAFAPERIDATLDELLRLHDHVVLQLPRAWATRPVGERRVRVNAEGFTLRAEGDQRTVPAPELDDDDRASLEQGLLPNDTEAGKAIGAVARELAGLRVGVALGAGSIRGYAHVGALRALERHGVPIDCLAGTSIGATVAAAYSIFGDVDEVKEFLDGLGARMFRPTVSRKSLLTTAAMRRYAGRMLGDPLLENTAIPIAVVATDVDTQDEVVLRRGHAIPAVFASGAVPGVFPAVRIGSRTLVDGGVVNPVPASVAASLGADVVIGIRLVHGGGIQADEISEEGEGPVPSAVAAIMRSIELLQTRIGADSGSTPLILVTPEFGSIPAGKLRHFRDGRRFIEAGEAAVEEALPRLAAALPWLRPVAVDTERLVAARS